MTAKLGISDHEQLTDFFKLHMTMNQRQMLMASQPLLYKKLYPNADNNAIMTLVREGLNNV